MKQTMIKLGKKLFLLWEYCKYQFKHIFIFMMEYSVVFKVLLSIANMFLLSNVCILCVSSSSKIHKSENYIINERLGKGRQVLKNFQKHKVKLIKENVLKLG